LRENLNGAAGIGTGADIEKRPDSMKLFGRKKYNIHLQNDNFRTAG
jgi:flagellar basal body P-ring protein FlgI